MTVDTAMAVMEVMTITTTAMAAAMEVTDSARELDSDSARASAVTTRDPLNLPPVSKASPSLPRMEFSNWSLLWTLMDVESNWSANWRLKMMNPWRLMRGLCFSFSGTYKNIILILKNTYYTFPSMYGVGKKFKIWFWFHNIKIRDFIHFLNMWH